MTKEITKVSQFKIGKIYKFSTDIVKAEEYWIPLSVIKHPSGRKFDSVTFIRVGDKREIKRNIAAEFIFKNNKVEEVDWE